MTRDFDPVPVSAPQAVIDAIEAVRVSGATNMLSRAGVMAELNEAGEFTAYMWVYKHPWEYGQAFFYGFVAEQSAEEEA